MAYTAIDHGIIRAIVAELPGTWIVDNTQTHGARITRSDDLELFLRQENDGKTYIFQSGIPQEHLRYNEKRPSIRVTLSSVRSKAIARDIAKRLLPEAETLKALIDERIDAHNAYENLRETLAATLGLKIDEHGRTRINEGAVWGDAVVYDDTVTLSLHSLSPSDALAILNVLRDV